MPLIFEAVIALWVVTVFLRLPVPAPSRHRSAGFHPIARAHPLADDLSMTRKHQSLIGKLRLLLIATSLPLLIGCVDYVGRPVGVSPAHVDSVYGPVPSSYQNAGYGYGYAGLNRSSTYHYYPRYRTYYSPQSRQYYYQRGSSWQTRSSPYGVSSRQLQSSHYVPLNINGSPSNHHNRVLQSYPQNWSPPSQSHNRPAGPSYRGR
jgi:hypothetical protein